MQVKKACCQGCSQSARRSGSKAVVAAAMGNTWGRPEWYYRQWDEVHRDGSRYRPLKEYYTIYPMTPLRALFSYYGTILPLVAGRVEPYAFVTLHVVLLWLNDREKVIDLDEFLGVDPWHVIGVPAGLLTFFTVFFTGQALTRFNT
eukprot:5141177-Prymnesium_polylepis.1